MKNTDKNEGRILELTEEIKKFLVPHEENEELYSHRTSSEEVARKILKEGFMFSDSFQKTTDQIVDDIVYIRYWDSLRKHYGTFIIVIGISKSVFVRIMKSLKSKFEIQQALSKILESKDENDDEEFKFQLPPQYVKGYIKRDNGEIIQNENYDPSFIPDYLEENLKFLNNL